MLMLLLLAGTLPALGAATAQAAGTFAFCGGSWRCNADRKIVTQSTSYARTRLIGCSKGGCFTARFHGRWRTVGDVRWVMAKLKEGDRKWDYYIVGMNYTSRVSLACKRDGTKCSGLSWDGYNRIALRLTRDFPRRRTSNFRMIDYAPLGTVKNDCKSTSFSLSAGPLSVPFAFNACDEIRSEAPITGRWDYFATAWRGDRTKKTRNVPLTVAFKVRSSLRKPKFVGSVRNPFGGVTRWRVSLGSA